MSGGITRLYDRKKDTLRISGDPKKAVIYLYWPLLLSFVIIAINGYLDSFWVSMLGADASSAVTAMMDLYIVIASVGSGIGVACAVTISFHLGKKDMEGAHSLAMHSLILCLILSVVVGIGMYALVNPVITVLKIEDLRTMCLDYITPLLLCNVMLLVNGALCGILRAEGSAGKVSLATLLIATSAIFDPLFIFTFDLGIAGAAWGTIAGTVLSTAYLSYLFIRHRTVVNLDLHIIRLEGRKFMELLMVGVPYSVQTSVRKLSNVVEKVIMVIVAVHLFGDATIAVFSLPWRYVHLLECVGLAFGAAMIPVVSYNIGRRHKENATVAFDYTLKRAAIPTLIVSACFFIFSGPLMTILSTDPSLEEHRTMMVQILAIIWFMVF